MDNEHFEKGLEAFKAKDYDTAVVELEQATMESPDEYKGFLYLGAAYSGAGRYNAAIGAFKRATELQPTDARVHYNLGQAFEAAGVPKEAFFEYSQALKLDPYYPHARMAFTALKARVAAERRNQMQFSV